MGPWRFTDGPQQLTYAEFATIIGKIGNRTCDPHHQDAGALTILEVGGVASHHVSQVYPFYWNPGSYYIATDGKMWWGINKRNEDGSFRNPRAYEVRNLALTHADNQFMQEIIEKEMQCQER